MSVVALKIPVEAVVGTTVVAAEVVAPAEVEVVDGRTISNMVYGEVPYHGRCTTQSNSNNEGLFQLLLCLCFLAHDSSTPNGPLQDPPSSLGLSLQQPNSRPFSLLDRPIVHQILGHFFNTHMIKLLPCHKLLPP